MADRKVKSIKIRILNALCAAAFVVSLIYIVFVGFEAIAVGAAVLALGGVAVPAVVSGEGLIEVLLAIVEAIVEGIAAVVDAVASAVASLLG